MRLIEEINNELLGKKIAVIGIGVTNQAVIKELLLDYDNLYLVDDLFEDEFFLTYRVYKSSELLDDDFDVLIKSPGIRYDNGVILRNRDALIINDIELSYYVANKRGIKIIGVTGTNGKTSTTTLLTSVLNKAGFRAFSCGNIGISPLQVLMVNDVIDFLVMELSSFQLMAIDKFKCYAAFFLNFSPDHLDYHSDVSEYFESKLRVVKNVPDLGCVYSNVDVSNVMVRGGSDISLDLDKIDRGISIDNIRLIASFLSDVDIDLDVLYDVLLNDFKGIEHRIEFVAKIDGVSFYNDSKATNVSASSLALKSFKNIILLAGGYDKKEDFSSLSDYLGNVKYVCAFGQNKRSFLMFDNVSLYEDLSGALEFARSLAVSGDVILLSPCSASYDQFDNYEVRGRMFKSLVLGDR